MTERKIIHLNQNYSMRVDFDLETKDIDFTSLFTSDKSNIQNHGLDLIGLIDEYGNCEDHVEVIQDSFSLLTGILAWIDSMDIEALKAEHAREEAEERREY